MLSSALIAVLFSATPAQPTKKAHPIARLDTGCNAQWLDPKFVHYLEKAPSEKAAPGVRLISDELKATPLVTSGASSCVTYLTRLDLVR